MKRKEFQRYLDRDQSCPCGCNSTDTLVPQHRVNRGMGGSRLLDRPANIIVLCSLMNGLIESDARAAQLARQYGWKLDRTQKPEEHPVLHRATNEWFFLDNDFQRIKKG